MTGSGAGKARSAPGDPGALQMVAVPHFDAGDENLRLEKGDLSGAKRSKGSLEMLPSPTRRPLPGGRTELVAGHGRLSAAVQSGAVEVRATVQSMNDRQEWRASEGPAETKRCPGCGQFKARSDYWRNARRSDGCATYCKDCGHRGSHRPPALLPTAPILPRLRVAVAGASYAGDPDYGVRRFARQVAATFGGDPEVLRVQLDRILRGDLNQITFVSADRLALSLGGSGPGFWRADW